MHTTTIHYTNQNLSQPLSPTTVCSSGPSPGFSSGPVYVSSGFQKSSTGSTVSNITVHVCL